GREGCSKPLSDTVKLQYGRRHGNRRSGRFAQRGLERNGDRSGPSREIHRGEIGTLMRFKPRLFSQLLEQGRHLLGQVGQMNKAAASALALFCGTQETVETGIA